MDARDRSKPDCCTAALRRSHRTQRDRLTELAEDLLAELPCGPGVASARAALLHFVRVEVIPRALAEETVAWSGSGAGLQGLVRALPGHHRMLSVLADEIASNASDAGTAAAVGALVLLCDARWDGEDEVLLPALASAGVDLEPLVG